MITSAAWIGVRRATFSPSSSRAPARSRDTHGEPRGSAVIGEARHCGGGGNTMGMTAPPWGSPPGRRDSQTAPRARDRTARRAPSHRLCANVRERLGTLFRYQDGGSMGAGSIEARQANGRHGGGGERSLRASLCLVSVSRVPVGLGAASHAQSADSVCPSEFDGMHCLLAALWTR